MDLSPDPLLLVEACIAENDGKLPQNLIIFFRSYTPLSTQTSNAWEFSSVFIIIILDLFPCVCFFPNTLYYYTHKFFLKTQLSPLNHPPNTSENHYPYTNMDTHTFYLPDYLKLY